MAYKLTFLGEPVSFNEYINLERINRFKAASIKKQETETIAHEILLHNIEPINYKIDVQFKIFAKNSRRDPDSYFFFHKCFFDGMQSAGIIKNDGQKQIGLIMQSPIFIDKDRPRIEVYITKHRIL